MSQLQCTQQLTTEKQQTHQEKPVRLIQSVMLFEILWKNWTQIGKRCSTAIYVQFTITCTMLGMLLTG